MKLVFKRHTMQQPVHFSGKGLHSGLPVEVTVSPDSDGILLIFEGEEIPCHVDHVTDTSRCTKVGPISTVEHLMSAMAGLGVTDARIELKGNPEMPAMDGCSLAFSRAMMDAGLVECGELEIEGPYSRVYYKGDDFSVAMAVGEGNWRYVFDLGARWPGIQDFEFKASIGTYIHEIAPARTFALEEEMGWIKTHGLGQGLDETSAFVIGETGFVNATKFADEPARHKLLDLIGDLYLSGVPLKALNVVAEKSGHKTNVEAAKKLAQHVKIVRR